MATRRIPLAWLNLAHSRVRLLLFSAGIAFACVLMFLQLGCRNALLDSSATLIEQLRAELFVVSRQQTTIILRSTFPRAVLTRALSVDGVESVHPLYLEYSVSLLRNTHRELDLRKPAQAIRVIGVDPDAYLLKIEELNPASPRSLVEDLRLPGRALFDRKSRLGAQPGEYVYGPVSKGTQTDLAGHRIEVVGMVDLGIDFGCDGNLIVGTDTFAEALRPAPGGMEEVDVGLVRLGEGADEARRRQVQLQLKGLLGEDVEVLTREEFAEREKGFWKNSTPIGYVFGFGMFMGFLVGAVICYQILSGDIRDNLQAYATLRAIGYRNRYLAWVVLEESLLLAGLGFLPGLAISAALYWWLTDLTGLPLRLTLGRVGVILLLTAVMCVGSGMLAVRQAQEADPADVF